MRSQDAPFAYGPRSMTGALTVLPAVVELDEGAARKRLVRDADRPGPQDRSAGRSRPVGARPYWVVIGGAIHGGRGGGQRVGGRGDRRCGAGRDDPEGEAPDPVGPPAGGESAAIAGAGPCHRDPPDRPSLRWSSNAWPASAPASVPAMRCQRPSRAARPAFRLPPAAGAAIGAVAPVRTEGSSRGGASRRVGGGPGGQGKERAQCERGSKRCRGARHSGLSGSCLRGELTGSRLDGATAQLRRFAPADLTARSGSPARRATEARRLGWSAAVYVTRGTDASGSDPRAAGCGCTAPRSAFVPSVRPSCASSPAAWIAVPTSSMPSGGWAGRCPGVEDAARVAAEGLTPAGRRPAAGFRGAAGFFGERLARALARGFRPGRSGSGRFAGRLRAVTARAAPLRASRGQAPEYFGALLLLRFAHRVTSWRKDRGRALSAGIPCRWLEYEGLWHPAT